MAARVEILDENLDPVEGLGIMTLDVQKNARMTSAPIENGTTTFDGKVIDPAKISVRCLIRKEKYGTAIKKLNEMYQNRSFKFYTIATKEAEVGLYRGYAVVGIPHRETAEMIDSIEYTITLQKVVVIGSSRKTKNSSDSDTMLGGIKV